MSQVAILSIASGPLPPSVPTSFTTDDGTATPSGNNLNIIGGVIAASGTPVSTSADPSDTVNILVQLASTVDSLVPDKSTFPGIASFNDDQFTVVDGFVSLVGSEIEPAIKAINVDTAAVPGEDPVFSDPDGILTITGAQVASGTTPNAIRTDSLADNSFTIQIQRSKTEAVSTIGSNGISHFDINDFSVDSSGFVQLAGGGAGQTITGNTGGPISPTAGNWNLITDNATTVFSGSGSTITLDFGLSNFFLGSSVPSLNPGGGATQNVGIGLNTAQAITTASANTIVGSDAALVLTTSGGNVGIGKGALAGITTGSGLNTVVGTTAATNLLTGTRNTIIGISAGNSYVGAESSNIIIGNIGTAAESNKLRIGTTGSGAGQQNEAYIAGIYGTTVVADTMTNISSSGQIGQLTALTNGRLYIGSTGASPVAANITPDTGIAVTNGAGSIALAVTGGGLGWNNVTGATQTVFSRNGYIANRGSQIAFTMNATNIGDVARIVGHSGGWRLSPAGSQRFYFGNQVTTLTTGYLESTDDHDCVELVALSSTVIIVMSSIGNITVV